METLEQRIERLQGELNTFEGRDNLSQDEIDRKNWLSNQLSEAQADLKAHQQREQQIEEKVETADVPFSVLGPSLDGLPAPVVTLIDKVVKADRKRIYNEHALEIEEVEDMFGAYKADAEQRIRNQDHAIEELRQDYEQCANELKEQTAETLRMIEERDDYRQKLANASIQLNEKDAEIARLNDLVNDYQKAKAYGERQAQQIIDIDAESVDEIQAAAEEVKKLYKQIEDWGSIIKVVKPDDSIELVKRDELENWQSVELPSIQQESSFRGEDIAVESIEPPVLDPEETVNHFREETGHDLVVPTSSDQAAVSRQEFEALKLDVRKIQEEMKYKLAV